MTDILRLTRLLIGGSSYTSVDLLEADGLKLQAYGWRTRTPPMEGTYNYNPYGAQSNFDHFGVITETIPLVGQGTVRAMTDRILQVEEMLERARKFHVNPVLHMPVWLEWEVDGEEVARRSLVYEGSIHVASTMTTSAFMEDGTVIANLVLTRHPFWESSTSNTKPSAQGDMRADGGQQLIETISGTAPARIEKLAITSANDSANAITRLWIGIRPEYHGTTDLDANWECEAGTMESVDATVTGQYVTVDFSDTETPLTERVSLTTLEAIGSGKNYSHMVGRYLILCRCKVTSGTVGLQMRAGYSGAEAEERGEEIFIDSTNYQLYELGEVQIPPVAQAYGSGLDVYIREFQIQLWAERVSGSGSIYLDTLILIPSEQFLYVDGISCSSSSGAINVLTLENDVITGYGASTGDVDAVPELGPSDWYLPKDNSVQIVAAQRSGSHTRTDTVQLSNIIYHRWYSYGVA